MVGKPSKINSSRSRCERNEEDDHEDEGLKPERKKRRVDNKADTDRLGKSVNVGKTGRSVAPVSMKDALLKLRQKRTTRFVRAVVPPSSKGQMLIRLEEMERTAPSEYGFKVRKPAVQRTRKQDVGKLARLLDAPIDILDEVASHLHPLDLLYLARTSRGLRDILMSKQSRSVWESSCNAIGLPEFPDELSCPEYISIIFEKECKVCGGPFVQNVDYELRWRLCKPCEKANVIRGKTIAKQVFGIKVMKNDEIYTLIPGRYGRFLKTDFIDVVEVYLSFGSNIQERNKFVEEVRALRKRISECFLDIHTWQFNQINEKQGEQGLATERRKEAIVTKLKELGYTDDDVNNTRDSYPEDWDKCTEQPRDLTPKIWKRIRPILEDLIKKKREKTRQDLLSRQRSMRMREIKHFFTEYYNTFGEEQGLLPSIQRILEIHEVKVLMERDDCQISITKEDWNTVLSSVNRFCTEHIETVQNDCLAHLVEAESTSEVKEEDASIHDLSLIKRADAFFHCKCCYNPLRDFKTMTYPSITEHSHEILDLYIELVPWGKESVQCDRAVLLTARRLLSCLNLVTATMKDMKDFGRVFVCLCCHTPVKRTWHDLVKHFMKEQLWYQNVIKTRSDIISTSQILLLDDHGKDAEDELAKIEDNNGMESGSPRELYDLRRSEERSWFCQYCRIVHAYDYTSWMTCEEAILHAKKRHNSDKGFEKVIVTQRYCGEALYFTPLPENR